MFTKYKMYFVVAAVISALLTIGYLKIQNMSLENDIVTYESEIETLSADKVRLTGIVSNKEKTISKWRDVYLEQSVYRKALQTELDEKTSELEHFKGRQDVVFKKPGLVQIKEQKALERFFNEVRDEK